MRKGSTPKGFNYEYPFNMLYQDRLRIATVGVIRAMLLAYPGLFYSRAKSHNNNTTTTTTTTNTTTTNTTTTCTCRRGGAAADQRSWPRAVPSAWMHLAPSPRSTLPGPRQRALRC